MPNTPSDAELNYLQAGIFHFAVPCREVILRGENIVMSHPVHVPGYHNVSGPVWGRISQQPTVRISSNLEFGLGESGTSK